MPRLCSLDGCERKHVARGLCGTHYNQQHQPNRHRKVEMQCDQCGKAVLKDVGRDKRYTHIYCSQLCRDYATYGRGTTCTLPQDHWARMIGKTCQVKPGVQIKCQWCGKTAHSYQPNAKFCGRSCQKRSGKAVRRAKEYGAQGTYTWAQLTHLWATFGKACAYCQSPTSLDAIQAEHVVALARGGSNNIGNILPSCASCNSDKRDLTLSEWKLDRARRELQPVVTTWHASDSRYRHLTPATLAQAA